MQDLKSLLRLDFSLVWMMVQSAVTATLNHLFLLIFQTAVHHFTQLSDFGFGGTGQAFFIVLFINLSVSDLKKCNKACWSAGK
ncbi:MAG: hypothetical protein KKC20_04395 [Proteobacteria bacterium]|nr:hypothetical protein [Pseudomonadota bacterium]